MNLLELLLNLFKSNTPEEPHVEVPETKNNKVYITLEDYKMRRDVQYPGSWLPEYEQSAIQLLKQVNALLEDLNCKGVIRVVSGFRPPQVNGNIGGAKSSAHMTGEAVDLLKDIDFDKIDIKLLEKFDLYMEDRNYTKTWVHLQTRKTKSGKRVFIP